MADPNDRLTVTSHVARDLLQSSALFKHERSVVWEYVANGLEYVDPGTNPVVDVRIDSKSKRITVADNGRGMSWDDLQNFFVMHGDNIDRKRGRPGRGFFGTGKSAAFGIAATLRVTTVRSHKRSKVELRRGDVEAVDSGKPIPVAVIEREATTDQRNGTLVEIEDIHLKAVDQTAVIRYIERHIARWPNATVYVNGHQCEFAEPPVAAEHRFHPEDPGTRAALGDVELLIKVSKTPLEDDFQGVAIFSQGVWHETTLAGSERKEMAQYIFGELDVPRLREDTSPIRPFDMSRSMQLNRSNELVRLVFSFVGRNIEKIRLELVEKDKERKRGEEAKKLDREASQIARIINEDFAKYRDRLEKMRAKIAGGIDLYPSASPSGEETIGAASGGPDPVSVLTDTGGPGHGSGNGGSGTEPPDLGPVVEPSEVDTGVTGQPTRSGPSTKRPAGGFRVDFRNMGDHESRALYERESRTIYVNLDHPQLRAAIGPTGVDDIGFKRLAYEMAFTEYAVALAREMDAAKLYVEVADALFDIRDTINRVGRAAAGLYAASPTAD